MKYDDRFKDMEYDDSFGERDLMMNDPNFAALRNKVLAKPHGNMMWESYIKGRASLKYEEDRLKAFLLIIPIMKSLKRLLSRKEKLLKNLKPC